MDSNTGTRRSARRRTTPRDFNNFELGTGTRNTGSRQNVVTQSQSQSNSQIVEGVAVEQMAGLHNGGDWKIIVQM